MSESSSTSFLPSPPPTPLPHVEAEKETALEVLPGQRSTFQGRLLPAQGETFALEAWAAGASGGRQFAQVQACWPFSRAGRGRSPWKQQGTPPLAQCRPPSVNRDPGLRRPSTGHARRPR